MRKLFLVATLSIFVATSASPQNAARGIGVFYCSDFEGIMADEELSLQLYQWVVGFASGMNLVAREIATSNYRDLSRLEPAAVFNAIGKVCRESPRAPITEGVFEVILNLPLRKK